MRLVRTTSVVLAIVSINACSPQPRNVPDPCVRFVCDLGAIVRADTTLRQVALAFTGHEFADGADTIISTLREFNIKASFFFTGDFYRNPQFQGAIKTLKADGHYLGAHSDKHLLYCDWSKRDSLLVTRETFTSDLKRNYDAMRRVGADSEDLPAGEAGAKYFLPPYEWYNDSISSWTHAMGLQLINFTHGTLSHADYTTPAMSNYRDSEAIYRSIIDFEKGRPSGLNGFILLSHIGTAPERTDKFYLRLTALINELRERGYEFSRVDEVLGE